MKTSCEKKKNMVKSRLESFYGGMKYVQNNIGIY